MQLAYRKPPQVWRRLVVTVSDFTLFKRTIETQSIFKHFFNPIRKTFILSSKSESGVINHTSTPTYLLLLSHINCFCRKLRARKCIDIELSSGQSVLRSFLPNNFMGKCPSVCFLMSSYELTAIVRPIDLVLFKLICKQNCSLGQNTCTKCFWKNYKYNPQKLSQNLNVVLTLMNLFLKEYLTWHFPMYTC